MHKTPITVLVADQLELVAIGLRELFAESDKIEVVGFAASGLEVLSYLEQNSVDIVLLDVSLPELDGIDTTRRGMLDHPDQVFVAHSLLCEIEYINSMLIEGARGYLLKGADLAEFETAFACILEGGQYLSAQAKEAVQGGYDYTDKVMGGEYIGLKPREREIIICIAKEMTNNEIADQLFISVETVRTHRKNLMTKLNVKSAAGLVKYAVDRRWV